MVGRSFTCSEGFPVPLNPWPNGLASRHKSTFNLRFVWPPTCVDFGPAQICTQVDASFSPFGHPTQVDTKLIVNFTHIQMTCDFLRLANPFGYPSRVHASSGCANLHGLAKRFGQQLKQKLGGGGGSIYVFSKIYQETSGFAC